MRRSATALLILIPTLLLAQTIPQETPSRTPGGAEPAIVVPAGTTVDLALTNPILSRVAKAGDSVYAQTAFPIAINNRMAIPPGTYVQGVIDNLVLPGWLAPHAQFQFRFTKLIFANGYTVEFPSVAEVSRPAVAQDDVIPAVAGAYVIVSSASDVLLDNGSQIEMVLQEPLLLDAALVAAAVRTSRPFSPDQFKSASRCRPIPGTTGTSDTVIPGTPGTPGTPPTVIPGAPGTPDIVIPGTPATPGTPDTVIPGSPSTPYIPCPPAPIVSANPKVQRYRQSFQIDRLTDVAGKLLPAGKYQVDWQGPGPVTQVDIRLNGNLVVAASGRIVVLNRRPLVDKPEIAAQGDGSAALRSIRFAGLPLAVYFDQSAEPTVTK